MNCPYNLFLNNIQYRIFNAAMAKPAINSNGKSVYILTFAADKISNRNC